MATIQITEVSVDNIKEIKGLWEGLRAYHEEKSIQFKQDFQKLTFEERIKRITESIKNGGKIKIYIAMDKSNNEKAGYCIGSITKDDNGKVDSLFVREEYRNDKVGDRLLEKTLNWLESNSVEGITIGVAAGNESVFSFYKRYGFYPAVTKLKKPNKSE